MSDTQSPFGPPEALDHSVLTYFTCFYSINIFPKPGFKQTQSARRQWSKVGVPTRSRKLELNSALAGLFDTARRKRRNHFCHVKFSRPMKRTVPRRGRKRKLSTGGFRFIFHALTHGCSSYILFSYRTWFEWSSTTPLRCKTHSFN